MSSEQVWASAAATKQAIHEARWNRRSFTSFVPSNVLPLTCAAFTRQNTKAREFPECWRATGRVRFSGRVRRRPFHGKKTQPHFEQRHFPANRPAHRATSEPKISAGR